MDPTNPLICKFTIRIGGKCLVDRENLSVTRLINLNSRRNIRVKIDTCFQDVWRPCLCYVLKFNHLGTQVMLVNRIYRWIDGLFVSRSMYNRYCIEFVLIRNTLVCSTSKYYLDYFLLKKGKVKINNKFKITCKIFFQ